MDVCWGSKAKEFVTGITLVAEAVFICWARVSSRPVLPKTFAPITARSPTPMRDTGVSESIFVAKLIRMAAEYAADVGQVDPAEHMVVIESWRVPPFLSSGAKLAG